MLSGAVAKMTPIMHEQMSKYTKTGGSDNDSSAASLSKGFQSALTLASSYTGAGQGMTGKGDSGAERMDEDEGGGERDEDDPYGLSGTLHTFNVVELCVRYTNRLSKDIAQSGEAVFGAPLTGEQVTHSLTHARTHSRTHSLTHARTHSLTHSLHHALTNSLSHFLTHTLTFARTHSLTHSRTHSLTLKSSHNITS